MRVLTFAVIAYLLTVAQATLLPMADFLGLGIRPDLLLLLAMFYAMYGRNEDVIIGGWALGLLADLTGLGRIGVFAFSFGLVALSVFKLRNSFNRENPFVHLALGLLAATLVNFWALFMMLVMGEVHGQAFWSAAGRAMGCAAYTAIVAPYFFWALSRFRKALGLHSSRRYA
jgi:rod shape-determining protein MreD